MKAPNPITVGILILLLISPVIFMDFGCASLQPGADPLVVRAEQLETTSTAAFDLVVQVDNANRGFWITNAPAFHKFAEYLRAPVPTLSNPNQPRGLGMILLLDSAKLQYQSNHSQSNILIQAVSDLQLVANQAYAWSTIIKTQPSTP